MVRTENLPNLDLQSWVAVAAVPLGHLRAQTVLMPHLERQRLPNGVAVGVPQTVAQVEQVRPTAAVEERTLVLAAVALVPTAFPLLPTLVETVGSENQVISQVIPWLPMVRVLAAVDGLAQVRAIRVLVTAEETTMQATVQPIAAAVVVAVVTILTKLEETAGLVSSSFALQASTTTIGRSQHGSMLHPKIKAEL